MEIALDIKDIEIKPTELVSPSKTKFWGRLLLGTSKIERIAFQSTAIKYLKKSFPSPYILNPAGFVQQRKNLEEISENLFSCVHADDDFLFAFDDDFSFLSMDDKNTLISRVLSRLNTPNGDFEFVKPICHSIAYSPVAPDTSEIKKLAFLLLKRNEDDYPESGLLLLDMYGTKSDIVELEKIKADNPILESMILKTESVIQKRGQ